MLTKRAIGLLALLSSLLVSTSESRATHAFPSETAEREVIINVVSTDIRTDEPTTDVIGKTDEIKHAVGVRESASSQVMFIHLCGMPFPAHLFEKPLSYITCSFFSTTCNVYVRLTLYVKQVVNFPELFAAL